MAYDNTNRGIISKNEKKLSDTHPDITGSINIEGKDYWLSGWKKQRNDGTGSFYSLSVKPKEPTVRNLRTVAKADNVPAHIDEAPPFDDDIGF